MSQAKHIFESYRIFESYHYPPYTAPWGRASGLRGPKVGEASAKLNLVRSWRTFYGTEGEARHARLTRVVTTKKVVRPETDKNIEVLAVEKETIDLGPKIVIRALAARGAPSLKHHAALEGWVKVRGKWTHAPSLAKALLERNAEGVV